MSRGLYRRLPAVDRNASVMDSRGERVYAHEVLSGEELAGEVLAASTPLVEGAVPCDRFLALQPCEGHEDEYPSVGVCPACVAALGPAR